MTPSEIATAIEDLKPRFLEGLAPPELQAILAAAKPRHYMANSVVTNQDHPADHLFLLLSGRARYFYITPDGQKTLLLWLPPGENALLIAFDYLIAYRAMHVSLTCHTARQRLATVLVNLASGIGHAVPGGIELDVNNEELANEANVTPFTASRLLSEWQRRGMVLKNRGKVLLRSPEQLLSKGA